MGAGETGRTYRTRKPHQTAHGHSDTPRHAAGTVADPSLTRSSSFEDFQRFLHGHARFSDACPEPCAAPALERCRTAVEGDACYEKVVWAMRTGVVERPDWYPSLTRSSSFEDFQWFLHGTAAAGFAACARSRAPHRRPRGGPEQQAFRRQIRRTFQLLPHR